MIRPGKHQARRTGRDCPCLASLAQIREGPCHTANMEIDLYKKNKEKPRDIGTDRGKIQPERTLPDPRIQKHLKIQMML